MDLILGPAGIAERVRAGAMPHRPSDDFGGAEAQAETPEREDGIEFAVFRVGLLLPLLAGRNGLVALDLAQRHFRDFTAESTPTGLVVARAGL